MKRILSFLIALSMILSLSSCGRYISSYRAIGLVRSQTSHSCEASFGSLDGQLVFKLQRSDKNDASIGYSVSVEEGKIFLYYDIYGIKEELAQVSSGDTIEGCGGYIESGKTVYIIIEATEGAKGRVSVELNG